VITRETEATLTGDGQVGELLRPGDRVTVEQAPHPQRFIKTRQEDYFSTLRNKLKYGRSSPHYARTTCCDRGYGRPSGRPRSRTLRRTKQVRLRSESAELRDGCPVARPSPRSRDGVLCIMRLAGRCCEPCLLAPGLTHTSVCGIPGRVTVAIAAGRDGSSFVPRLPAWSLVARLGGGRGRAPLPVLLAASQRRARGSPTRSRGSGSGLPQSLQKNHHGPHLQPRCPARIWDLISVGATAAPAACGATVQHRVTPRQRASGTDEKHLANVEMVW